MAAVGGRSATTRGVRGRCRAREPSPAGRRDTGHRTVGRPRWCPSPCRDAGAATHRVRCCRTAIRSSVRRGSGRVTSWTRCRQTPVSDASASCQKPQPSLTSPELSQRPSRTPGGVKYFGDGDRPIRRVAVCGGAGDGLLLDATRAGADAFVTADLRHHPASEHLAGGGPALIDPGHWASEWPWLALAASALIEGLNTDGADATTVETRVSTIVTDPASGWVPSSD